MTCHIKVTKTEQSFNSDNNQPSVFGNNDHYNTDKCALYSTINMSVIHIKPNFVTIEKYGDKLPGNWLNSGKHNISFGSFME
jgi:hypothetical protein